MTQTLQEVKNAISLLGLEETVLLVEDDGQIYKELLSSFVVGKDRRWWWEAFQSESSSISFDDGKGFERVLSLLSNPNEVVWFMIEDDELPYYPICSATANDAVRVIGECFAFEYYLISKSHSWLICENHHDQIIGIGKDVVSRMAKLNQCD